MAHALPLLSSTIYKGTEDIMVSKYIGLVAVSTLFLSSSFAEEFDQVERKSFYTDKPHYQKLGEEKVLGKNLVVRKVELEGSELPLVMSHQRPLKPTYEVSDFFPTIRLSHYKGSAEGNKVKYFPMHMELSDKKISNCVMEQLSEISKSKYFSGVHKDYMTSISVWETNLKHGDKPQNAIDKSEFNTEIGESNDMSEFSIAISRSGLCWPIYSWQIDRKLKEKYPKIIQRVEAELKNSKESISDSKRKSNVPQIIDEQTSFESNEAESM
jgi:hypothetical protein